MSENLFPLDPREDSGKEAEETLRLVAELPPPAELTDRVHQRLAQGLAEAGAARRGFWSLWMPAQRLQFAAAAVLAVAVAGSMWGVYHGKNGARVVVAPAPVANPAANPSPAGGGFGSAGAERVPPTLTPIKAPPAPKKKPGAGHAAVKHAAKPQDASTAPTNP